MPVMTIRMMMTHNIIITHCMIVAVVALFDVTDVDNDDGNNGGNTQ